MFYFVITKYLEFMTGKVIITRARYTDYRDARAAFVESLYHPDCIECKVITEARQIIMFHEECNIDLE